MQANKTRHNFAEYFLKMDNFRQPFEFLLPDKQTRYRTCLGATLSILLTICIVVYGSWKAAILTQDDDYKIETRSIPYFYDQSDALKYGDGFMVAAGVTRYDGNEQLIEDPSIGQLKFYYKKWGGEETSGTVQFTEIATKPCNIEEFSF